MTTKDDVTTVMIPWKKILVPDDFNYRQVLTKVKDIAASLKERGQLSPVVVRNGGTEDKPYTLVAGGRRMAAFEENGWTGREIRAEVREYKANDVLGPAFDNWHSNEESESTSPFDQAEFVHNLASGYPHADGTTEAPMQKADICKKLNFTESHLGKLLKLFRNTDPDVARKARKNEVPMRVVMAISNLDADEGIKDKDAKAESKAQNQMAALDEWIANRDSLAASGRKRGERSDKGKKKAKKGSKKASASESKPLVNPHKRLDDDGNTPAYFKMVLMFKFAAAKDETERAIMKRQLETSKFFLGETSKFPGITKADMAAFDKAEAAKKGGKEEEEAEEEAEEEGGDEE